MNDLTAYNCVRDQMRTGDLLAWKSSGIIGRGICLVTNEPCSHVGLIVRMAEYEGQEKRRFTSEATARGVFPCLLSPKLEKYHGEVWWYPLKDEYSACRAEIGERAASFWGFNYGFLSIAKQLISRVSVDARDLFCSEYVQIVFRGESATSAVAQWPGEVVKWPEWDKPIKLV